MNDMLAKLKQQTAAPAGNTTPEETLGDMLSKLNTLPGTQVGMSSTSTGAVQSKATHSAHLDPLLPGYYTLGFGVVRLPNRTVVRSTPLRGQFYYPLDSPAATFLEARVGKGVTKVLQPVEE